ncbi:MAG: hypothetical protein HEP71_19420 [Roseivirga sp.]|nr:hypothetical protein [Roseivirga sp.]
MKKLLVILLLAFFTVGITSCAEDFTETDPIAPEISNVVDGPDNGESEKKRKTRVRKMVKTGS